MTPVFETEPPTGPGVITVGFAQDLASVVSLQHSQPSAYWPSTS
jgi:hypothetical protein